MTAPAAATPDEKAAELDSTTSLLARLNELFPRIETPDGHYTAPEVSRRYGVSKNAIIGSMGGENWVQRGLKVFGHASGSADGGGAALLLPGGGRRGVRGAHAHRGSVAEAGSGEGGRSLTCLDNNSISARFLLL